MPNTLQRRTSNPRKLPLTVRAIVARALVDSMPTRTDDPDLSESDAWTLLIASALPVAQAAALLHVEPGTVRNTISRHRATWESMQSLADRIVGALARDARVIMLARICQEGTTTAIRHGQDMAAICRAVGTIDSVIDNARGAADADALDVEAEVSEPLGPPPERPIPPTHHKDGAEIGSPAPS